MKEKKWTPKGQALGEVVRKRRRELGLSQEDMAREIGRALDYIKLLERGMRGNLLENLSPELSNDFAEGEEEGKAKAAARHAAQRDHRGAPELTQSDNAMLVRGTNYYPPLRGTLLSLCDEEHSLYTHGSVPYYKAYPGLHVPRPLGIRPCVANRSIESIASEILSLTKLNWNRARLDSRMPITLLTAQRVGEILRHVDACVTPAPRYANYM